MLCHTCQRQANCLTHQLAEQDPNLYPMLEQLQRCQRHQPRTVQPPSQHLQRVVQWMDKLSRKLFP